MTQQPPPDLLGSIVKRYREQELQLSQVDLAWLADVSRGTISNLETNRVTPDERTWHRIRTALALPPTSPRQARGDVVCQPVISADAVQGIIAAILAIRDRNPEIGQRTAERWRRLAGRLSRVDNRAWPAADSELTWLASEVALMAPPGKLPVIHEALRSWGWMPDHQTAVDGPSNPVSPASSEQLQELVRTLTHSVNDLTEQLRVYRDKTQGWERLPAQVQELLTRGLLASHDVNIQEALPGFAVVDLVVVNEDELSPAWRRGAREATLRWGVILKVARYILEHLALDRDPQEIINAVEYALKTQKPTEVDRLRQKANRGQPIAMYDLSRFLRKNGRPDEGELWLRRAAEAEHPGALLSLAMLIYGNGRPDEAEPWLRRAAEAGHADAMFTLWKLHQENRRPDEAARWLYRAAEAGHRDAMFALWKLSQENRRPDEAARWLYRAAEVGHRDAMFTLWKLSQESGLADEAAQWLRRAANADHPHALIILAQLVREDGEAEEAARLLRRAAEVGDSEAINTYEIMLYEEQMKARSAARATP